ncbi:type I-E CRISPR-associated protein Cas7/Cse4/CasC [Azospirillum griseum]|uniref:Type I-E CRISPR-associated protein Cas7/Cse4/CasC n=1 Tax=Azospirillum griseum TaxID=2496639 RepID=A0A3S0KW29_9PROT|nr:type I-E CRISPR-associated protein Cas7/Cse4/CasC [Azospirillum griseum]RTR17056.1 type I-E CRISPR-associated protein Cas7/Cse4/CasC [Azospirillum griseum]
MTLPRFLQIHTLTPYAAALLNRDDVGRAKRLPFGGVNRTRVSSQCLKRHWRTAVGDWSLDGLGAPMSVRSRQTFVQQIAQPLRAEGFADDAILAVVEAFQAVLLGESAKAKAEKAKGKDAKDKEAGKDAEADRDPLADLKTGQVLVLGHPEVEFIRSQARALLQSATTPKDARKAVEALFKDKETLANFKALRLACGLDAALFGRMVTSDILARGDAAVHVAHSFTVHGEDSEPEFFTAVDDLEKAAGELGSGMMGDSELTSGLFYGYVVIDLPLLLSNLEGVPAREWEQADRTLALGVVERLIRLIASVSPGAKLGSTAPYAYAHTVLVELGDRQPRTLANAFLKPVRVATGDDLAATANARLSEYLTRFDAMYGAGEQRLIASLEPVTDLPATRTAGLADLTGRITAALGGASS